MNLDARLLWVTCSSTVEASRFCIPPSGACKPNGPARPVLCSPWSKKDIFVAAEDNTTKEVAIRLAFPSYMITRCILCILCVGRSLANILSRRAVLGLPLLVCVDTCLRTWAVVW